MAMDVYLREDIANVLRSVNMAGGGTAALVHQEIEKAMHQGQPVETADLADRLGVYQQGYRDALGAVAAAFGILPNPETDIAPDMLVAHNAEKEVDAQYVASSWRLKCPVST